MIDLAAVRADTPGAMDHVFLDSAGSSLPPAPVLDEVLGHLRREAEIGGYRAANERHGDLEEGYSVVARLLGCRPEEVAFTDSATRSWLTVLDAIPLSAGDRVLVTEVEYAANAIALLRRAEETGASIETVPSDASGALSLDALHDLLDERVKLVSLVHVPTNSGLVNPVREVVEAAHRVGALVLLDACQSVGQLPIDVTELGVDLLSATGRKWLRGPRGTGILVVRSAIAHRLRPRLVDLHGGKWQTPTTYKLREDARVYELWENGIAERLGLIAAARYALDLGMDQIAASVGERAAAIRDGLSELPGVRVRDLGEQRCGLVSFTVDGIDGARVRDELVARGITLTASFTSSTLLDMTHRGLESVVRASPHYFVAPEQIEEFLRAVSKLPQENQHRGRSVRC
jgi:cysteine desulfurase / selenocysteine lyase